MYPGSLPLIFNGSVPGHEKVFNVRRCSMYTGAQFDRFHCSLNAYMRELSSTSTNTLQQGCKTIFSTYTVVMAVVPGCTLLMGNDLYRNLKVITCLNILIIMLALQILIFCRHYYKDVPVV